MNQKPFVLVGANRKVYAATTKAAFDKAVKKYGWQHRIIIPLK